MWGDPARYRSAYWSSFAGLGEWGGYYVAGDGATRDEDGNIRILGRLDDVVNVSGHRLSTIEIESALVARADIAEAGATGVADPVTGQRVVVFAVTAGDARPDEQDLRDEVARAIGPVARPHRVVCVPELPKTRSGKILRRLLAQLWEADLDRRAGRVPAPLGDTTSLQNPDAVAAAALTGDLDPFEDVADLDVSLGCGFFCFAVTFGEDFDHFRLDGAVADICDADANFRPDHGITLNEGIFVMQPCETVLLIAS